MMTIALLMFYCIVNVTAYPGALCNVTYNIPVPCKEVLGKLSDQVEDNLEDNNDDDYFNYSR